jgi:hypothetical protein
MTDVDEATRELVQGWSASYTASSTLESHFEGVELMGISKTSYIHRVLTLLYIYVHDLAALEFPSKGHLHIPDESPHNFARAATVEI